MTQPPTRNLPPDAEIWGRWVEDQVRTSEQERLASSQSISNSLAAINGTLIQLGNQISTIAAQQITLGEQQVTLAAQQAWLASATLYSSTTDPNGWEYTVNPPAVTDTSPAYNATYDSELTFTAPITGEYLVTLSTEQVNQISVNTGWGALDTRVDFEVYDGSLTQLWDGLRWATTVDGGAGGIDFFLTTPLTKVFPFLFYEGNTYRLRTRRRAITSHGGASTGHISTNIRLSPFAVTRANLV